MPTLDAACRSPPAFARVHKIQINGLPGHPVSPKEADLNRPPQARDKMAPRLVQSAKLHGHDPRVHLRDVLKRLLAPPSNLIDELLPHIWKPTI